MKEGQTIKAGQPIGLSGNSGFSAEPHLHINVLKDYYSDQADYATEKAGEISSHKNHSYDDYRYTGTSSPFTFDGRFYVMNDIIEVKR